ncbi:hypothetical protein [Frankia sp. CiP3]|uniref:hypothetical protein n=1 Tax=Frankia sp. CiP3 TaxID=2880971 RepID=UPI001EF54377|nr:hypothetical protein [Frankia sp. CiP3]
MPGSVGAALVVEDAQASEARLAAVLQENRQLRVDNAWLVEGNVQLCEENHELREQQAQQAAELERLRADLAVLQRLLFGRSSERSCPEASGGEAADGAVVTGRRALAATAAGRSRGGARGRGRVGGTTQTRRGSRCSGISRKAGIAAHSAVSRSRCLVITCPGSNWTGR